MYTKKKKTGPPSRSRRFADGGCRVLWRRGRGGGPASRGHGGHSRRAEGRAEGAAAGRGGGSAAGVFLGGGGGIIETAGKEEEEEEEYGSGRRSKGRGSWGAGELGGTQ